MLILTLKLFLDLNNLALEPLKIFQKINSIHQIITDPIQQTILERIAIIAANGGIPLQLMNQIPDIKLTDTNFTISPLLLNNWVNIDLCETVIKTFNNYKNFGKPTQESLKRLFWNPLLVELFAGGSSQPQKFNVEFEWNNQYGDVFDLTVSPPEIDCPVLIVDIAKENIGFPFSNKNSVRLYSNLTVQCIEFCKYLEKKGLDPSKAKVYGLWIGGSRFQIAVAEPVITENENTGGSEIHIVISCEDVAGGNVENGDLSLLSSETRAQPNMSDVKKLEAFIHYVKDQICRLNDLHNPNPFKPIEKPDFKHISLELISTSEDQLRRRGTSIQSGSSDITNAYFKIKKPDSIETRLYLKHFKSMYIFPHLIDISPVDTEGMVTYTFEKMSPLIDRTKMAETNQLASIDEDEKLPLGPFVRDYSVDSLLFDAVLFAVHTLYGLHVLHVDIGAVHSDISINNVMFSKLSNIWKLIDFEYALPIEVSLNNSRRNVGTNGFVAPESETTGIYTEKSDLYSLGATIRCTFEENMWKDLRKGKRCDKNALILLKSLVNGMCETDPTKRLSVIDALSQAYSLVNRLLSTGNYESFAVYGEDTLLPEVKRLLANVKKSEEIK